MAERESINSEKAESLTTSKNCRVEDVAAATKNALVGGPFGSNLVSADYVVSGIPVIRGQNMSHGRWIGGAFVYVSEEKADRLSANIARPGDLIFTQRGTLGQVAIVPDKPFDRYLVSQSQMKLTVDSEKADPMFLYYVFSSQTMVDHILRNAIQAGVPHTNLEILRRTPVRLPALAEQSAIARILGALDDKLELNRRMNETLEAMARAIFKSWFVNFDPVRAKKDGRHPPGMDAETAALFPDCFQDSPFGKIPKGWSVRRLGEVTGINKRTISADHPHKTIEYIEISSVATGKLSGSTRYELHEAPSRAKRLVAHGDTIWSCVRPNRKSYLFLHNPAPSLIVSTGFAVLTPKQVSRTYLYEWVTTEDFVEYLSYSADGSAYPAVRPQRFSEAEILLPPLALLDRFEQVAGPMRDKIAKNDNESRALDAIRDALLPKLISGEMRIPNVQ